MMDKISSFPTHASMTLSMKGVKTFLLDKLNLDIENNIDAKGALISIHRNDI
jgi:hypothetical protein